LQHWDHGFKSPFKIRDLISLTPRGFNDLKWGHQNPIICATPNLAPCAYGPNGTYSVQSVGTCAVFLTEIVGNRRRNSPWTRSSYQIRTIIVQEFSRQHRVVEYSGDGYGRQYAANWAKLVSTENLG